MSIIYRQLDAAGLLEKYLRPVDSASILPDPELPEEVGEEDDDSFSGEEDEEEDYSNDGQEISDDYFSDDDDNQLFGEAEDAAAGQEEANITGLSLCSAFPTIPPQHESDPGSSDGLPDDYYDDLFGESGINFSADDLAAANANTFLPEQASQSSPSPAAPTVQSQSKADTASINESSGEVFDDLFGDGDSDLPYDEQAAINAFMGPQATESSPSPSVETVPSQGKPDAVAVNVPEKQNPVENPLSGLALPKFARPVASGYELHLPKIPRPQPAPAVPTESVSLPKKPVVQGEIDMESQLQGLGDILAEANQRNATLPPIPTTQTPPPSAQPATPQRRTAAQPPVPTPPEAPIKDNSKKRSADATPTRPSKAARVETQRIATPPPQFDHDKYEEEQFAGGNVWDQGKEAKKARKAARARTDRYNAKMFGSMGPPPPSQSSHRPPASFVEQAMASAKLAARASGKSEAEAIVIEDDEEEDSMPGQEEELEVEEEDEDEEMEFFDVSTGAKV